MLNLRSVVTLVLVLAGLLLSSPVQAQAIDAEKLEAAKKAAYEKFMPQHLRDGKPIKPINVDNAVPGQAAYIYGNSGPRPTSTISGPVWRQVGHQDYLYGNPFGNYNYNYNFKSSRGSYRQSGPYRPFYNGFYHPSFFSTGFFAVGDNYTLPSVFQDNYDSRYRRGQPKLFKVRTRVPQHYVYKNGRYHFVGGHTKTEYVPLVTKFVRTRYGHGHHSVTIDYSN